METVKKYGGWFLWALLGYVVIQAILGLLAMFGFTKTATAIANPVGFVKAITAKTPTSSAAV